MIEIHLHLRFGSPTAFADSVRILLRGNNETGNIARVDSLKKEHDVAFGEFLAAYLRFAINVARHACESGPGDAMPAIA